MAPDDIFRQIQFEPQPAHFVLEQIAQRLDQFELKFGGQTTHVVVQFDRGRRTVGGRAAFDDVRIQRTLCQESGVFDLGRLCREAVNEAVPDPASFLLRIADALEFAAGNDPPPAPRAGRS